MKYLFVILSIYLHSLLFAQVDDFTLPILPIWYDEFDKGIVDTVIWKDSRFYTSHTRYWPGGVREKQYYIKFDDPNQNPSNNYIFEFDNSIGKNILSLAATRDPITARAVDFKIDSEILPDDNLNLPNLRNFDFRSGELNSRMLFKYGLYVIRFKMPKGCGFWPAFWLWSPTHSDLNCSSNCAADEIDFFEWESENPTLLPANVHYDYQNTAVLQYDIQTNQDLTNDYHILLVEWQPYDIDGDGITDNNYLKWYFDPNDNTYPLYPNHTTHHKFDYPMGLLLNNAVGGPTYNENYDQNDFENDCIDGAVSSVGAAQFPAKYSIDHVAVFYRVDCNSTENICNWNPSTDQSAFTGGTINVAGNDCNVVVPGYTYDVWDQVIDGNDLRLYGVNQITLKPGFHAKKGSRVVAAIRPDCNEYRNSSSTEVITENGSMSFTNYLNNLGSKTPNTNFDVTIKKETVEKKMLSIFPNPSTGIFTISLLNGISLNNSLISIYDNTGRLLISEIKNTNNIDLTNCSNGIYFIEVKTEIGIFREKIIKQ